MSHALAFIGFPEIFSRTLSDFWKQAGYLPPWEAEITANENTSLIILNANQAEKFYAAHDADSLPPVLMIGQTERQNMATENLALPVKLPLLATRILFYLTREAITFLPDINFGAYTLRPSHKKLIHNNGAETSITDKESAMLSYLAQNMGNTIAKQFLLQEIWGYEPAIDTYTLETHIYRVRKKLEQLGGGCDILSENKGYILQCS